jgi:hypothetical protein
MNNTISEAAKILTDPEFFRAAVSFTAQRTGFAARLIEKDYFCSVLLEYLASASKDLVFKGADANMISQELCPRLNPARL